MCLLGAGSLEAVFTPPEPLPSKLQLFPAGLTDAFDNYARLYTLSSQLSLYEDRNPKQNSEQSDAISEKQQAVCPLSSASGRTSALREAGTGALDPGGLSLELRCSV